MAGEREQREALDKLHDEFRARAETLDMDSAEYAEAFQQMSDEWQTISAKIAAAYPLDVPNAECHHAMLRGIAFQNQPWKQSPPGGFPAQGERVDFFRSGPEAASLWTHKEDDCTVLLVEVDLSEFRRTSSRRSCCGVV
ncbi:hypothetical protein [Edaphobacter modestus]|uniref:Uncharacterized protein n=1 Tax=Edaphobacter modestus TaxID=388466 RepID=A0A4Q7YEJ6_9BACT|nr:hypothetical protein [Edaphobacter modestus]RZU35570.1 hypothetical protein BDD14_5638 [Edaphobacter modestus]